MMQKLRVSSIAMRAALCGCGGSGSIGGMRESAPQKQFNPGGYTQLCGIFEALWVTSEASHFA